MSLESSLRLQMIHQNRINRKNTVDLPKRNLIDTRPPDANGVVLKILKNPPVTVIGR